MNTLSIAQVHELEELVDKEGMSAVVHALQHICHEKEQHVWEAWQDRALASAWRRGANLFNKLIDWPDWPL